MLCSVETLKPYMLSVVPKNLSYSFDSFILMIHFIYVYVCVYVNVCHVYVVLIEL